MIKYKIDYPMDSPERTMHHRTIIKRKYFLRKLYEQWYRTILEAQKATENDVVVELGSGGGFIKDMYPFVICSDVIDLPCNDMTFSALEMPFKDNTVDSLIMIDTMHHIPDAELFLKEAERILKNNGKIIMLEPANTLWGRFLFKNFHHEAFDTKANWKVQSTGPLSGANQALPWIVFFRDREIFMEKFPALKIKKITFLNPLTYILSGGLSYRQLLPNFSYPVIKCIDKILPKISKQISMFMLVEIQSSK